MHDLPLLRHQHPVRRGRQDAATVSQRPDGIQRRQLQFQDIVDQPENRFILPESDTEPRSNLDPFRGRKEGFERERHRGTLVHVRENRPSPTRGRHHLELQLVPIQNVRGMSTKLLRGQVSTRRGCPQLDAVESVGLVHERDVGHGRPIRFREGGERVPFGDRGDEARDRISRSVGSLCDETELETGHHREIHEDGRGGSVARYAVEARRGGL